MILLQFTILLDTVNANPLISAEHNSTINHCYFQATSWWVAGLIGVLGSHDSFSRALTGPKAGTPCVSKCHNEAEKSDTSFTSHLRFSNWTAFMSRWNIKKKKPSVLQHLLHSLSYSNTSKKIVFKRARRARCWGAETAVMWCNFVHAAREETPTVRLWNPSLSPAAASSLSERGGLQHGLRNFEHLEQQAVQRCLRHARTERHCQTTTLFIFKPAGKGTGGCAR